MKTKIGDIVKDKCVDRTGVIIDIYNSSIYIKWSNGRIYAYPIQTLSTFEVIESGGSNISSESSHVHTFVPYVGFIEVCEYCSCGAKK